MNVAFPFGLQTAVVTQEPHDHGPSEYIASQWVGLFFKKDFQTREQFSPSQIDTARGCLRAWGYRYVWGLRTLEIDFNAADLSKLKGRDRSLAFGKAMHREGETYYTTGHFDETTLPGRAFLSGLHLLPHPTDCAIIEIELGLSFETEPKFVGFKDLVVNYQGQWFLFDYKSTRDFQWMKTAQQLQTDLAASLYATDIMQRESLIELPGRYVYFKSEGRPQARPSDVRWNINQANEIVEAGLITADHLRTHLRAHTMPGDLEASPSNCKAYGGCPYRKTVGGPCDGESTGVFLLGTALANLMPKGEIMPEVDQLPNESDVTYKIRKARTRAAGQAPATAPMSMGFAPPPPAFLTPPPTALAQPPFPLPQGAVGVPLVAHILPPEAAQPQAQLQPAPSPFPAQPAQTTLPPAPAAVLPPVAPPVIETTASPAPAKRRGRLAGSKNTPHPATPGQIGSYTTTRTVLEVGDATITIEASSESEAQGLAELIQGLLA